MICPPMVWLSRSFQKKVDGLEWADTDGVDQQV